MDVASFLPDRGTACPQYFRKGCPGNCGMLHELTNLKRLELLIAGAKKSVKMAMFILSHMPLVDILVSSFERGVECQVLLDSKMKNEGNGPEVLKRLREVGMPVYVVGGEFHFHHKFCVIDESVVVTGSCNWTTAAFLTNREAILFIGDDEILNAFIREFQQLWEDHGPSSSMS
ncbi:unnamed protein product [Cyprideis torosa]|uniref:Mitochondrial cardiolipin hydrolase n=1 Tax=Cyprideis torosa TaxID=163714 RepID=A0A7R8WGK8_9CRUS|nr:unnamed protein product [Cyprideis torosa]CAG0892763.1 unnamed protein product [Cyprideis torosa]